MCENEKYFSSILRKIFPAASPMHGHAQPFCFVKRQRYTQPGGTSEKNYISWKQRHSQFEESCFLTLLRGIKHLFGLPCTIVVTVWCAKWLGYFGRILNSCKMPFCLKQTIFISSSYIRYKQLTISLSTLLFKHSMFLFNIHLIF